MNRLLFLLVILTITVIFGACESEAPLEPPSPRVDTLVIYDSAFIIDTTVVYDTVFSYDSLFIYDSSFVYDTVVVYDTTVVNDTLLIIDSTVIYDTLVIYDSITVYDTLVVIDSVIIPEDQDSLVYQGCLILECDTRVGTLGEPGYFVTVSRKETNGHAVKFCLYVYRQEANYVGILSATHLKTEWPVVKVKVEATNNTEIYWWLDKKHQTKEITF